MILRYLSLLCFLLLTMIVQADEKATPAVPKILLLGNSITLHGPAPEIGWTGNWGMAATAEDKDYAHLLLASIERTAGAKPKSLVRNLAGFERGYATYDFPVQLREALAFEADIVVLAIGENVPALATPELQQSFAAALGKLLAVLGREGKSTLYVRSCFWANSTKDEILRQASKAAGATFVDIGALGADPSNRASSERKIDHAGVAGHPGDKGMRELAQLLFKALEPGLKK